MAPIVLPRKSTPVPKAMRRKKVGYRVRSNSRLQPVHPIEAASTAEVDFSSIAKDVPGGGFEEISRWRTAACEW